ncbi:hypothetical protein SAMN06295912_1357 [Sphingomonas laterariae]|uniref:Uncharacterized protein n=1 Tax=Edaphosphingomonas laterariae TaxID=861865 RepID=A0A239JHM0_9SPHN|nr:hypothetical protein SAMN06295912_1357 [Sphingomonas laterariae]
MRRFAGVGIGHCAEVEPRLSFECRLSDKVLSRVARAAK